MQKHNLLGVCEHTNDLIFTKKENETKFIKVSAVVVCTIYALTVLIIQRAYATAYQMEIKISGGTHNFIENGNRKEHIKAIHSYYSSVFFS